ncbi:MAG: hypothetical protein JST00_34410 [Deltaproteobacteria bacterium]|nr:hypothetical protein [Deltaproteobacteria bacterium]
MRSLAARGAFAVLLASLAALEGCGSCSGGSSNVNKIEAMSAALERDDTAALSGVIEKLPRCEDAEPVALGDKQPSPRDSKCLTDIANALGSKRGFNPSPPDQAAAATAAVMLMREGRGDFVAHLDNWLNAMKNGKGAGADALRLAVAKRMAEVAPKVGKKIEDDATAAGVMKEIVTAIPGACPTYQLLGAGKDPTKLAPELSSEHSYCVQHDLTRREGPGASYGAGMMRALEGSLAAWRETERALRLGLSNTSPGVKATLENRLKVIEPATQAIATKKLESASPQAAVTFMGEVHAEAGILLWKGAGGEAGVDAGPPSPPPLRRPLSLPSAAPSK